MLCAAPAKAPGANEAQPPICRDCRHFRRTLAGFHEECVSPRRTSSVDLVTGKRSYQLALCSSNRMKFSDCGPHGALFEPRRRSWWMRVFRG